MSNRADRDLVDGLWVASTVSADPSFQRGVVAGITYGFNAGLAYAAILMHERYKGRDELGNHVLRDAGEQAVAVKETVTRPDMVTDLDEPPEARHRVILEAKSNTTSGLSGKAAMSPRGRKQALLVVVDKPDPTGFRCLVDFSGLVMPVSFPKRIIEELGLSRGDRFEWWPAEGRDVMASDCRRYTPRPLSPEEREARAAFKEDTQSLEEILEEWDAEPR